MPRDYKNMGSSRHKIREKKTGRRNGIFSFIACLLLVIAAIIYFKKYSLISAPYPPLEPAAEEAGSIIDAKEIQIEQSAESRQPEPRFDFYRILPRKKVNISEWTAEEPHQAEINETATDVFVLQIGSFQEYDAADAIKAKLAMIGIAADIQRVVINGQDIHHRVRIGPYKNLTELGVARDLLLANNIDFVLLKLKTGDT